MALLLIVVSAAAVAGYAVSAFAQTGTTPTPSTTTSPALPTFNGTQPPEWGFGGGMGAMMGEAGFGGPGGRMGRGNFAGQFAPVEISAAFNQTVNNILGNDTDVQKLVAQGYNVTSIHPILSSTLGADGAVTTKATTAIVTMQNGTTGYATVNLDITNAKVTQIVIVTRTIIDKSSASATTATSTAAS